MRRQFYIPNFSSILLPILISKSTMKQNEDLNLPLILPFEAVQDQEPLKKQTKKSLLGDYERSSINKGDLPKQNENT